MGNPFRDRRTALAAGLVLAGALVAACPAAAQLCQVPLSIQKGDVDANIMILLDNSGSMNEVLTHPDFVAATIWPGTFEAGVTYSVPASAVYTIDGRDAYLVSAPNGQDGRYDGNYLNWIFYVATDEQLATLPRDTRMDVAQMVVKTFIDRTDDVFLGLATFDYDDGAKILAECGTSPTTLMALVDGIAADAYTPLGEAMEDLLDYFMRTDDGAPILFDCQKSFVIILTDGLPTRDLDVSSYLIDADGDGNDPGSCSSLGIPYDDDLDCSDHVDDVAWWARHNDLIDWLGEPGESWEDGQTVVTYTIGFDVDHALLAETAANGDGLYLTATDAAELWASLEAIMVNVRQRVAAGSAVAVVSSESSDTDHMYRGKYNPSQWMGFVECFDLPYEDMENPAWDAGAILADRDPDDRRLFTVDGGGLLELRTSNAGRLVAALGVADEAAAADVVAWTRGEAVDGLRVRELDWKLGDVVHAAPVVVGAPAFFTGDMSFQDYLEDGSVREKMLYVAANDGMLHGFRASDGHEMWAFVPGYALSWLPEIASPGYCHRFTVDLTPAVTDALVGGTWLTVLVSGEREGGPHYFALDVTHPDSPQPLWETEAPDGLPYGSEVAFGRIGGRPVVLVGSGVDRNTGRSALHVFDLADGRLLDSLPLGNTGAERNKASTPSPVDLDFDDETDLVYIADLTGTVYRVDFNGSLSAGSWDVTALYRGDQPIMASPRPAYGGSGLMCVYFGTGVYIDEPDILDQSQQSFCCVFDRHDGRTAGTLVDQTGGATDVGDADGWYIDLEQLPGERVTEPAVIAAETVFFTSYAPFDEPCRSGGESFLYELRYDDGAEKETEERPGQRRFRGGGIASRPVLDLVNGTVSVQYSNQTIIVKDIDAAYAVLNVKAWQEDYSHATGSVDGDGDDDDDNDDDDDDDDNDDQ